MTPAAQIIMPAAGFLGAAIFFQALVKRMVTQGVYTEQQVKEAEAQMAAAVAASATAGSTVPTDAPGAGNAG